ncbi:hypothetical protein F503_08584 [Ophiostoma piceae UAMH 11346]|uniref:Uncharacterized protein n=1 Tax=Ophiostoma piceae (strain UAMH 11346) TaxID=1262450 RepID=S3BPH8_OPHP1|nr:hypothetical protein F503_08584 [Ophiostoma piceae UAMH 11346]
MLSISRAQPRQLPNLQGIRRLQKSQACAATAVSPAAVPFSRSIPAAAAMSTRTLYTHTQTQALPLRPILPPTYIRTFSSTPRRRESGLFPDLDRITSLVAGARDRLLSHPGIPPEGETATALRICAEAADLVMDTAPHVQAQPSPAAHAAGASLLELGSDTEKTKTSQSIVDFISDAAFAIVDDKRVFLTASLLEQYVQIQARLGRPNSLPRILEAYASRPAPRNSKGTIAYKPQNPKDVRSSVAPEVADAALDTALVAKSLDAAVGVVEWTYAAPAFVRYKLLRRGLLPGFVVVGVPMATYILASQLATYQQTMDTATATGMSFAAILAYIGFTGTIGVVANATANDQMRRVTWAPGTPLRERWLREEERDALDKVACAFGFREAHRYGEEEGAEFQALREYIMSKGMLMDQVELMEGMSS